MGGIVSWLVTGSASADWVGAIGQWVGGIGTIAAVLWAAHVFRDERRQIDLERAGRLRAQEDQASRFSVNVRVHGRSGLYAMSFAVTGVNETNGNVVVTDVEVPVLTQKSSRLPQEVVPGIAVLKWVPNPYQCADDDEVRHFGERYPVTVTYSIDGVSWVRTGEGPPARVSELS